MKSAENQFRTRIEKICDFPIAFLCKFFQIKLMLNFKTHLICIYLLVFFASCNENYEREVFLGMKLGTSVANYNKYAESLIENKKLIRNREGIFNIKKTIDNKEYYLIPYANYSDTIITVIKVLVADKKSNIQKLVENESENADYMGLGESLYSWNNIPYDEIEAQLLSELKSKYGNPDLVDTTKIDNLLLGTRIIMFTKNMLWKDKNGVDINFIKRYSPYIEPTGEISETTGNIKIIYSYNDKMKSKLPYRKNDF